jgi:PAS domain S-box-containing protein
MTPEIYAELVNNLPVGIIVYRLERRWDPEALRIIAFNAAAEQATGLRAQEIVNHTLAEVAPERMQTSLPAQIIECIRSGQARDLGDVRGVLREATYAVRVFPLKDDRVGVAFEDVTERRRIKREIRDAHAATEAVNRELESFSTLVAHDLRAPLQRIDAFSLALLEDYADKIDQEGRNYLRFLRESTQQMAQLITDLLNLSRVTLSDLDPEDLDLGSIAQIAAGKLQRGHPDRQVEFVIQKGLEGGVGNAPLLSIVLDNLLGNAWKFTGKNDKAHVEFGATSSGEERAYFVRDNGVGFDMAKADKLFGIFQRLHPATEFEGTGAGLATVQRIIHRHGGRVWAEGQVGQGATFYFTLGKARQ